jgi:predicted ATP-dependent endonuclease of OLD family
MNLPGLDITPTAGERGGMQFKVPGSGQYRSDEVGNGMTQLFVALLVAAQKTPSLILIDEPELGLHPKLQLSFLAELQQFAQVGLVFSTHNLGLALNAADRVYSVTRHAGTAGTQRKPFSRVTRFAETPELPVLLGSLSYASYGSRMDRHVLLVEGPTDLRVMQAILYKLGLVEHVVVMHMGGNTTLNNVANAKEQLAGVQRLCQRVWCVIDSDAAAPGEVGKLQRPFLEACKALNVPVHVTERRATENYISDAACKVTFGNKARSLGPHEKIDKSTVGWNKDQAWKAAALMEPDEFEDIAVFLGKIVKEIESTATP